MDEGTHLSKGVKTSVEFAGEYLLPGGSNLVKGDLKQAGIHAFLGIAARAFFGLPGLLLVSANSFSKAATGRHLYQHLGLDDDDDDNGRADYTDPGATRGKTSAPTTQAKPGS